MSAFLSKLSQAIEPVIGVESMPWTETAKALGSPQERALSRLHRRESQRQANIERIVALAAEEIQEEVSDDAVAADWLGQFFEFAQDVSDETAQLFWARLLAVQIAVPDAIFKRTLVQLRNMDRWELNAFIEYCSFAFAFESGWRFMFEDDMTRREIWGYVRGNDYTQHFINIGLLAPETSIFRPAASKGMRIRYYEKEYVVAPPPAGDDPKVGYRKFTVTGQQLTKAMRSTTYYGYARNMIKALESERSVQFLPDEESESGS